MIRGHLDALTAMGFVEGWCFDESRPDRPLRLRVTGPDGVEVAAGHANLFRADLANAGFGYGWCAFRLRLSVPIDDAAAMPLALRSLEPDDELTPPRILPIRIGAVASCNTIAKVVAADPTVIGSVDQLRAHGSFFIDFMNRRGIDEFIETAYIYTLGRPVDETGRGIYAPLLATGTLLPFDLLTLLATSDEFRSRPRVLAAPNTPAFLFGQP